MDAPTSKYRVFRASGRAYLVVSGIVGALFLFLSWGSSTPDSSQYPLVAAFVLVYALTVLWLRSFEIRIQGSDLTFRSLFRGRRRLNASDISRIELRFDFSSGGGPLKLVAEPKEGAGKPAMMINAKVFGRDAVQAVLDFGEEMAQADASGLQDGVVPKVLREMTSRHEE